MRLIRRIVFFAFLLIFIISLINSFSILINMYGDYKHPPKYLLENAGSGGILAFDTTYFAIDDDGVKKISEIRHNNLIFAEDNHYSSVWEKYYHFDVNARSKDPSDWEYEISEFNDGFYDTDILTEQIKKMELSVDGKIDIEVTKFDDYYIVEVTQMEDDDFQVIDSYYAVFHNGERLAMKKNIELDSIRVVRKYS